MPVSPQDFALYSRMTGVPVPSNPLSRMQMAPDVYKFTKDFTKKPNILEATGNLVKTIGKTVGTGFAAAAAAPAFVEEPQTTAENYKQNLVQGQTGVEQVIQANKRGAEIADSETVSETLSEAEESMPVMGAAFDEQIGSPSTQEDVDKFLGQFKGEGSPNMDRALLGLLEPKEQEQLVGQGISGAATSLPYKRFEHPDMKADGGEHDDNLAGAGNFETGTPITPPTAKTPSASDIKDKYVDDLTKQAQKDLRDPDAMMDKPSFSYPTTRAGRTEVGLTEGGDIYQIFKKDPQKTYITRATPRQAEMFQEMLPGNVSEDRKKTEGAGGFLEAFTNKTFDF